MENNTFQVDRFWKACCQKSEKPQEILGAEYTHHSRIPAVIFLD